MAFFEINIMQSLSAIVSNLSSNISIFKRMSRTISQTQLSEVRACLDDVFKEVESRHQIEMVDVDASPEWAIINSDDVEEEDDNDDNDWSTIASDDEDGEEEDVEPVEPQCNCHETTAQPIFALPDGITLGECPICYDEIKMINMAVTRCGHVFHASCAFECLERRIDCPLCRTQLVNEIFETEEDE